MLASGRLNAEATAHAIEVVDRNTRLQARIIEDLLDVSRIISGKMTLRLEDVALGPALEAAVDSVRTDRRRQDAWRWRSGCEALDRRGRRDAGRLQQVFANLLSNAVKFTPAGGRIVVTADRAAPSRSWWPCRTPGAASPTDLLPFIFEPFRQAEGRPAAHPHRAGPRAGDRPSRRRAARRARSTSPARGRARARRSASASRSAPARSRIERSSPREDERRRDRPASLHGPPAAARRGRSRHARGRGGAAGSDAGVEVMAVGSVEAALAAIGSAPPGRPDQRRGHGRTGTAMISSVRCAGCRPDRGGDPGDCAVRLRPRVGSAGRAGRRLRPACGQAGGGRAAAGRGGRRGRGVEAVDVCNIYRSVGKGFPRGMV